MIMFIWCVLHACAIYMFNLDFKAMPKNRNKYILVAIYCAILLSIVGLVRTPWFLDYTDLQIGFYGIFGIIVGLVCAVYLIKDPDKKIKTSIFIRYYVVYAQTLF